MLTVQRVLYSSRRIWTSLQAESPSRSQSRSCLVQPPTSSPLHRNISRMTLFCVGRVVPEGPCLNSHPLLPVPMFSTSLQACFGWQLQIFSLNHKAVEPNLLQ